MVEEFSRRLLKNQILSKKFFADVVFIHTSASGAMGDPGVLEVWTKNFEHYSCHWTYGFDVKKFHRTFMRDEDMPHFGKSKKSGWQFFYMGCGHNFYIKEEFAELYLKKFGDGEIYPDERIMLEILNEIA